MMKNDLHPFDSSLPFVGRVPMFYDERGSLGVIQSQLIPFEQKRTYFIHGTEEEVVRGNHAHRKLSQIMISLKGEIQIQLKDGLSNRSEYNLSKPSEYLYIPPAYWRTFRLCSMAVCLVLASSDYDPQDYIHNYEEFVSWKRSLT
jgi:dTDP-4-dehydrorhamnose 3,5-epimerase-like enzyme